MWISIIFSTLCRKTVFPPLGGFGPFVEVISPYMWTFISGLSSPCHGCWHRSVLITVASPSVLKSGSMRPSILFFFFKIILSIQGPLRVHVNFRWLSYFWRRRHWDFSRDHVESVGCVGCYWLLNNTESSDPRTPGIFSFTVSLISFSYCFVVFNIQIFHLLGEVYSWVFSSFWCECKWDCFLNALCGSFVVSTQKRSWLFCALFVCPVLLLNLFNLFQHLYCF